MGRGQLRDHIAIRVLHPRHIGQQKQAVRFQGGRDGTCGGVAVHVECLARRAHAKGGDDGNETALEQVVQQFGVDRHGPPHQPQFRVIGFAQNQPAILARQTHRLAPFGLDGLHDALVDRSGQHHFHDFHRRFIGHALAAHEIGFDIQPLQQVIDHRPTAMDDDRVHAHLAHQHDVACKRRHLVGIAHRVPAELDHDNRAGIALQIGKGLGQGPGGGKPVLGHGALFLHQVRPAMIARRVEMPSPFSDEVTTISG